MQHVKKVALLGAIMGATTLVPAMATAGTVSAGCDTWGGRAGIQVCGGTRIKYVAGTCKPVKFDDKWVKVRVTNGEGHLEDKDPLRDWTFELTNGKGEVVFARYNFDVQEDDDGTIDLKIPSAAFYKQGSGHLSMGGEVNVNNGWNHTASLNVDIPPRKGCLA